MCKSIEEYGCHATCEQYNLSKMGRVDPSFIAGKVNGERDDQSVEISPILAWSDIKYIAPVTYPDTVRVTFDAVKQEDRLHGKRIYTVTN